MEYLPVVEYHDQFLQVDCWRISAQDSNFSWVAEFLHTRKIYNFKDKSYDITNRFLIQFYIIS